MIFTMSSGEYRADPRIERALDVLFILHADHEQNCSTSAVRSVGSSQVDPYSAVAAGVGALYGPLHGGANEAVLRMLNRIGTHRQHPDVHRGREGGQGAPDGLRPPGLQELRPARAKIIKKAADDVFEVTGVNPMLAIAVELEKIALEDDYFVKRKLYPNVDFYSGLIYEALGMPVEMFPVFFAIGRTPGWVAQWLEMLDDKEQKISRPRQVYVGADERDYVQDRRSQRRGRRRRAAARALAGPRRLHAQPGLAARPPRRLAQRGGPLGIGRFRLPRVREPAPRG